MTTLNGITVIEGTTTPVGSGSGTIQTKEIKLVITGTIVANTNMDVNASGANYTKTGDTINIGVDVATFNGNNNLLFYRNGVEIEKGDDVIYVDNTTVKFVEDLYSNEEIFIKEIKII